MKAKLKPFNPAEKTDPLFSDPTNEKMVDSYIRGFAVVSITEFDEKHYKLSYQENVTMDFSADPDRKLINSIKDVFQSLKEQGIMVAGCNLYIHADSEIIFTNDNTGEIHEVIIEDDNEITAEDIPF